MARIRTIKPEFPQSESMGRVSRDARLLFILLWPICDDHGRTRADSRMLASLLYPYDNDEDSVSKTTKADVDAWLGELEREGCIKRFVSGGSTYLEIINWLIHQKIDKPSKPQFPEPSENAREDSRNVVVGREGKGREGIGEEGSRGESTRGTRLPADWKPTADELRWAIDARPDVQVNLEVEKFRDYWHGVTGAKATKRDWPATWRNWIRNAHASHAPKATVSHGESPAASRPL